MGIFKYGTSSLDKLETCDERIQIVFYEAIRLGVVDITILEGARSDEKQYEMFLQRKSECDGIIYRSKHQTTPQQPYSFAVDAAAYPIDWSDHSRFTLFAGFIIGVAASNGIKMTSGTDWDRDFTTLDHNFFDGPHFEVEA